ncbi:MULTISPECIES: hypothetical protein [unclassified Rhizobium]|uniref:hypothetical protein n=1 Tax=unclassified Rhizobium TaxID=2613769 RepID=UPI000712FFEB|nr:MULTISPECIES: hypothetical protein [unclassified Rhizobium]KQS87547.1 hypothetical protein ASG42_19130 [Rhizobium sp. Leaf391]KQT06966.1 hypothetical protein ASG50_00580 [Rhizobium sp. Leaf386]KQT95109.1 hypothetical protein ASG68_13940 [Rhizobium sp. Leaf453]
MNLTKVFRPQPSERWAMYRLVCPVVDAACEVSFLEPFFEYPQPNGPNKRLSADIALMAEGRQTPIWLVEAKKFGKQVHPGMIDPYLNPGAMGCVTNGNQWIFKIAGRYLSIGPLLRLDGQMDESVYRRLVTLIATVDEGSALVLSDEWTDTWTMKAKAAAPSIWKVSGDKGTRAYQEKIRYETLQEAAVAARAYAMSGTLVADMLDQIIDAGLQAPVGWFEVNQARIIWWVKHKMRGARLKLTGRHIEMLVDNVILDRIGRQNVKASIKMHDKNMQMSMLKAGLADELAGLVSVFGINPLRA